MLAQGMEGTHYSHRSGGTKANLFGPIRLNSTVEMSNMPEPL